MASIYDTGTAGATNPAKQKFIASAASKAYTGPSIVDYLAKSGYPNDPTSRTDLAKSVGISDYSVNPGNAAMNTDFLSRLRGGATGGAAATPPAGNTNPNNPVTGAPNPASSPTDPYRAAYDKYLAGLTVSPEEQQAKQYLNRLTDQAQQDQETALNRGETMGFASGEAARVNRNNQFAIDSATRSLSALTGYRTASTDQAKAKAEFEKNILDAQNKNQFDLSPGQERYAYDAASGSYKKVASVPVSRKTSVTSVNGNRVIVDSETGEVIKTLGKATTGSSSGNNDEVLGQDLTDAEEAIKQGANKEAVYKRFIQTHPSGGAAFKSYFASTTTSVYDQ